jgi:hypothetical protein
MKITITISDKEIKQALETRLEAEIYDNFYEDAIKRAKVPSKAKVIKQLMSDDKFMAELGKQISIYMDIDVYDAAAAAKSSLIDDLEDQVLTAANQIQLEHDKEAQERSNAAVEAAEAEALARTIRALEEAGYKITKA